MRVKNSNGGKKDVLPHGSDALQTTAKCCWFNPCFNPLPIGSEFPNLFSRRWMQRTVESMVFSSVREMRNPKPHDDRWTAGRVIGVIVTFAVITTLWSLWNAPSLDAWFALVSLRGGGA